MITGNDQNDLSQKTLVSSKLEDDDLHSFSSITEVEKRAVRDSAEQAGAKEVYLLHEPMAAALGYWY